MLRIGLLTGLSFVNSQGREACQPSKSPRKSSQNHVEISFVHGSERLAYYDFWTLKVLVWVYIRIAQSKVQAYHNEKGIDDKELPLFGEL